MRWQNKEKKDAKDFKGRRTPRSGGFWSFKGDIVTDDYLIDSKSTSKNSYSITPRTISKVRTEALRADKELGFLSVILGDGTEFVVVEKNDFILLLDTLNKNNLK